jgi:DNA-directed RNA polymerase specialized sigma24 family protein
MDQDEEFVALVSARWSSLVRSAVFLGCAIDEAHDLVQSALLRCYLSWRRVESAANRDAYIYRVLLNTYRDSHRRR